MASTLSKLQDPIGRYGKTRVSLVCVRKSTDSSLTQWRDLIDFDVDIMVEGFFKEAYTIGDNASIVATDTLKNICYYVATNSSFQSIEKYGVELVKYILGQYSHLTAASAYIEQQRWNRVVESNNPHDHSFFKQGDEKLTSTVTLQRGKPAQIVSGLKNLQVMKVTQSGFTGFYRDEHTTLPETDDRILCTDIDACWTFRDVEEKVEYQTISEKIRTKLLTEFSGPSRFGRYSPSLQKTMYDMLTSILNDHSSIERGHLSMKNVHHFYPDSKTVRPAGLNHILYRSEAPAGLIQCTVDRVKLAKL